VERSYQVSDPGAGSPIAPEQTLEPDCEGRLESSVPESLVPEVVIFLGRLHLIFEFPTRHFAILFLQSWQKRCQQEREKN